MKKENKFQRISWFEAFKIINKKLLIKDSSNIKSIVGDLTDLESIFLLKKNFNKIGVSNIFFENYLKDSQLKINSDLTSNFLFNNSLNSIDNSDFCLIINSDIRKEGSILNIHLINRLKKGNFKIAYIGNKIDYTYPIKHLGTNLNTLIEIISGKHSFCKNFKNGLGLLWRDL